MFELKCKDVMLANLTTRTQKEGVDDVPAATLKCEINLTNAVLEQFDKDLLASFYSKVDDEDLKGVTQDGLFPHLKYESIEPIKWTKEYPNYRVTIVEDMNHDNALFILPDCVLKAFQFDMKEKGAVKVTFNINCDPGGQAVGWLYDKQKHNILLTIEAPEVQELEGFEETEADTNEQKSTETVDGRDVKFDSSLDFIKNTTQENRTVAALAKYQKITKARAVTIMKQLEKACHITTCTDGSYLFNDLPSAEQAQFSAFPGKGLFILLMLLMPAHQTYSVKN